MNKILFTFLFLITSILAEAADTVKWVAPWGNDTGSGESFSPYKTLNKALSELDSGTIMFRATDNISVFREEVIIDGGATKGISQPIIVHTKNKSKTEKTSAA